MEPPKRELTGSERVARAIEAAVGNESGAQGNYDGMRYGVIRRAEGRWHVAGHS